MTFAAAVVMLAYAARVHGVIKCFVESLFFVISCIFAQGVKSNVSEICKQCVH